MVWVVLVVVVLLGAVSYAFRPELAGSPAMWLGIGGPYLLLTGLALQRLARAQRLRPLLGFRAGDASLGILLGIGLLTAAWLFAQQWLEPGSSQRAWLFSVFLLAGDPEWTPGAIALLLVVVCEELVWRGWVQLELREALGARRGWICCALLYALVHVPTLFSLSDPDAGKNPLLLLAALGGGLCWSFLAERTGRLLPSLFSHAVFSYFASQSLRLLV